MVGVFAGLKWRLVSSRFRRGSGRLKLAMVIGWVVAGLVLLVLCLGFVQLRTAPVTARTVVISLFTLQMISWVLAPLVAFGLDETVDPSRFALLPLTGATLQRGLLVSSLVGYLPAANAVVLLGAAVALSSSWALLPVALVCVAAQLVLCVTVSRAASTAMSSLMAGRRGRDLGMLVGSLLFLVYLGLLFGLNRAGNASGTGGTALGGGLRTVGTSLAWGPNGSLAAIPSFVSDGHWGRLLIAVVTVVLTGALGWWWWSVALHRTLTSSPSTSQNSAPAGRGRAPTAVADSLGGMVRLVASRDRLLTWRDPVRRIPWVTIAALSVLWPLLVVRGHGSLYAVGFAAAMAGAQAGNQFAVEGTGVWLHMVAFADRTRARGETLGHAVFVVIPGLAVVVPAVLLQAWIRHDWHRVPAAMGTCLALLLGAVAVSGYVSARLPYAVRQSRSSMFANSVPGQKGRTTGAVFLPMLGGLGVAIPAIVLLSLSLTIAPWWGWAALLVGPVCGVLAVILMSDVTARTYLQRMPEILATVAVGDRS